MKLTQFSYAFLATLHTSEACRYKYTVTMQITLQISQCTEPGSIFPCSSFKCSPYQKDYHIKLAAFNKLYILSCTDFVYDMSILRYFKSLICPSCKVGIISDHYEQTLNFPGNFWNGPNTKFQLHVPSSFEDILVCQLIDKCNVTSCVCFMQFVQRLHKNYATH